AALQECVSSIKKLISEYDPSADDQSKGQMKARADQICEELFTKNLGYFERVRSCKSVVHPVNRWGMGLDPFDVHAFLAKIVHQGWSDHELKTPRALEIDPLKAHEVREFNRLLWTASDGQLPLISQHDMKIATLTCSHTAAGQRAVLGQCTSHLAHLCTDGRLCRQKVAALSPSYNKSLTEGIPWFVIRHQVATAIPELADFLSEAGNVGHGIDRKQTDIQAMFAVHKKTLQNKSLLGDYKLDAITRQLEATSTHLEGKIRDIGDFVIAFGGGSNPTYIKCIEAYSKVPTMRRDLPSSLIRGLAALPLSQAPDYVVGIIKASLVAPEGHCNGGEAKLFSASDVSDIAKRKSVTLRVQSDMVSAKEWLKVVGDKSKGNVVGGGTAEGTTAKLYGDFQVRMTMFLHKKKAKHRENFVSTEQIKQKLISETILKFPASKEMEKPWDLPNDDRQAAGRQSQSGVMREFAGGGVSSESLKAAGMDIGVLVQLKGDEDTNNAKTWNIIDFTKDGKVSLAPSDEPGNTGKGKSKKVKNSILVEAATLLDDYEAGPG
ncbi:unnamed protein product, partial [Prorocentrum cordatum]